MEIGDTVVRKSYGMDISFKIIDKREEEQGTIYILKGISIRIVADSPEEDLKLVSEGNDGEKDKVFNMRVNSSIRNILVERVDIKKSSRSAKNEINKDLSFGRPGKILHVDGDSEYLKVCMKLYKQFALDAVGKMVSEKEQPSMIVPLVKEYRPDIVVITGHDGVNKNCRDFIDIDNYRNSKYFVKAVSELRNYQPGYDELVIFAGACQSNYEALLDAGATNTKVR